MDHEEKIAKNSNTIYGEFLITNRENVTYMNNILKVNGYRSGSGEFYKTYCIKIENLNYFHEEIIIKCLNEGLEEIHFENK